MADEVTIQLVAKREDVNPKEGENKYGNVPFADEKNHKYPIDTAEHIRAAWNYINKSANAGKYSGGDASAIKGKIVAAWKSKIDPKGPPSAEKNDSDGYFIDEYVTITPGDAYRLLPFGTFTKNGVKHTLTPENAKQFKLPHWKPAIKLGSHDEVTPSGGRILGLKVGEDGLYAIPEYTAKGLKSVTDGDFAYHSPEIVWDNGAIEDPKTGELVPGPTIVGDALLHNPHLGEDVALYTYEPNSLQGDNMATEEIKVSKDLWDNLTALFTGKKPEAETPVVIPDEYKVAMQERDEMKAKIAQAEQETAHKTLVEKLSAELQDAKFGKVFADAKVSGEMAEHLSAVAEPQREFFMRKIAALAFQVDFSKLGAEFGVVGLDASNPVDEFTALINEKQKVKGFEKYASALNAVRNEHPEIAVAYDLAKRQGK